MEIEWVTHQLTQGRSEIGPYLASREAQKKRRTSRRD